MSNWTAHLITTVCEQRGRELPHMSTRNQERALRRRTLDVSEREARGEDVREAVAELASDWEDWRRGASLKTLGDRQIIDALGSPLPAAALLQRADPWTAFMATARMILRGVAWQLVDPYTDYSEAVDDELFWRANQGEDMTRRSAPALTEEGWTALATKYSISVRQARTLIDRAEALIAVGVEAALVEAGLSATT